MSTQFIGEIRPFGGNFAPRGWHFCDGSLQAISQYDTLFVLIGTTYGGDGQTTFALPNLLGRLPVGQGQGPGLTQRVIGQIAGTEGVTLNTSQLPSHIHMVNASTDAGTAETPGPGVLPAKPDSATTTEYLYVAPTPNAVVSLNLASTTIAPTGGSQPHENRMPAMAFNYIIAMEGIFPSRN